MSLFFNSLIFHFIGTLKGVVTRISGIDVYFSFLKHVMPRISGLDIILQPLECGTAGAVV